MRLGYACINLSLPDTRARKCILKNASPERLKEITYSNLINLKQILEYNISRKIQLFRISSEIIPFASHTVNTINWRHLFKNELGILKKIICRNKLRVSMHPGQYTVLNSPQPAVLENSIKEIIYHTEFLDSITESFQHRIILHIGGIYNSKKDAIQRFTDNFKKLPLNCRKRLTIENDEKCYDIFDVLKIARFLKIPAVFDNLHHQLNGINKHSDSIIELILKARKTWNVSCGIQKIHYSQPAGNKNPGAHSETIEISEFKKFIKNLSNLEIDIMLEVKDKNISVEKLMNII